MADRLPALEYRCNTAVSCLAGLSFSLELDLSFEQVAGMTGEAFRCPLFANAALGAWQHSVSWPHSAMAWLDALGIDAVVSWCDSRAGYFDNWLARQQRHIDETLASGLPVMYWDSLAFGLIYAADGDSYTVSGIPLLHLPPELQNTGSLPQRCFAKERSGLEHSFEIGRRELAPLFEGEALFIHPQGLVRTEPEYQLAKALRRAGEELAGQVSWPRMADGSGHRLAPLFGTAAMLRLENELKSGEVQLHGLILHLQSLHEMRRCAHGWLHGLAASAPSEFQSSLKQAAEFERRIVELLRPVAGQFSLPAEPLKQMKPEALRSAAAALYEVRRTEETLARLLLGLAGDLGVFA
jgi:hypothetical protein